MTGYHSTVNGAVNLIRATLEGIFTSWAYSVWVMSLFLMPSLDCTGWTKPFLTTTTGFCSAIWASCDSSILKVFTMNYSMTMHTEGNAIFCVVSQFMEVCKWFNMMGMQLSLLPTAFTGIIVAFVDSLSPFYKFIPIARSFIIKTCAAFPSWCIFTDIDRRTIFPSAFPRAIYLFALVGLKLFATLWTSLGFWRIAMRPAFSGAIMRVICSVCFDFIFLTAYLTNLRDATGAALASVLVPTLRRASRLVTAKRMEFFATDLTSTNIDSSLCHSGTTIP